MELHDIIKNDDERLFIVDNECFLIFTGDSIEDEKPFIRIGTWKDMPPLCIQLIENVVITDKIVGNPAIEQFNINPENSSEIKYIGSKKSVQSYVDFQKIFGLDLSDASIVDVETDIPLLSTEKIIFNNEAIIGVFYYDGNFRIVFNGNNIFDLKEIEEKSFSGIKIHELLSDSNRETGRFKGAGLTLIDKNLLLYKNGNFVSYQFPGTYYRAFNDLNIDPFKIRHILIPSPNFLNLSGFFKWGNSKKSRPKIYSDLDENFSEIISLFPDLDLVKNSFKGLNISTGEGLNIENYGDTLNIKLRYLNVKPGFKSIEIAYMKEYAGLSGILEEKLDAILVPASIYEQAAMYFRSARSPALILSDGSKNISKLQASGNTIIYPGIQYEFMKYESLDDLLQDSVFRLRDREIISRIIGNEGENIKEIISLDTHGDSPFRNTKNIFNILSVLKIYLNTTTDRKFSHHLKNACLEVESLIDRDIVVNHDKSAFKISMVFFNGSVFEFIEKIAGDPYGNILNETPVDDDLTGMLKRSPDIDKKELHERIIDDRERLNRLLELYRDSGRDVKKDLRLLSTTLDDRKKRAVSDNLTIDGREIKKKVRRERLKKVYKVAVILLIIITAAVLSYSGYLYYMDYKENLRIEEENRRLAEEKIRMLEEKREKARRKKEDKKELIKKYDIHVTDRDIYFYANKVAGKNGYRSITFRALKKKNPNWIFPGNVFWMMDGEKIVVKKGDTLWALSEKKLMERNIEFYKIIDEIKEGGLTTSEIKSALKKAREFAFNEKHYRMIESLKK